MIYYYYKFRIDIRFDITVSWLMLFYFNSRGMRTILVECVLYNGQEKIGIHKNVSTYLCARAEDNIHMYVCGYVTYISIKLRRAIIDKRIAAT